MDKYDCLGHSQYWKKSRFLKNGDIEVEPLTIHTPKQKQIKGLFKSCADLISEEFITYTFRIKVVLKKLKLCLYF